MKKESSKNGRGTVKRQKGRVLPVRAFLGAAVVSTIVAAPSVLMGIPQAVAEPDGSGDGEIIFPLPGQGGSGGDPAVLPPDLGTPPGGFSEPSGPGVVPDLPPRGPVDTGSVPPAFVPAPPLVQTPPVVDAPVVAEQPAPVEVPPQVVTPPVPQVSAPPQEVVQEPEVIEVPPERVVESPKVPAADVPAVDPTLPSGGESGDGGAPAVTAPVPSESGSSSGTNTEGAQTEQGAVDDAATQNPENGGEGAADSTEPVEAGPEVTEGEQAESSAGESEASTDPSNGAGSETETTVTTTTESAPEPETQPVVVEAPESETVVSSAGADDSALEQVEATDPEVVPTDEAEKILFAAATRNGGGRDEDDHDRDRSGRGDHDDRDDDDRDRHDRDRDRIKPWQKRWDRDDYGRPIIILPPQIDIDITINPVFVLWQENGHWQRVPLRPGHNPINTCTSAGANGYLVVNSQGVALGGGAFFSSGHCYGQGWHPPRPDWRPPHHDWHPPALFGIRFELRLDLFINNVQVLPGYYEPHRPIGGQHCVFVNGLTETWGQYYVPAPVRGKPPVVWTPDMPTHNRFFRAQEHRPTLGAPLTQGPPAEVEDVGGEASSLPPVAPTSASTDQSQTGKMVGFGLGAALVAAALGLWARARRTANGTAAE